MFGINIYIYIYIGGTKIRSHIKGGTWHKLTIQYTMIGDASATNDENESMCVDLEMIENNGGSTKKEYQMISLSFVTFNLTY